MKMLSATMPTKPAAIHSIVSMKRSIHARFMSAPNGWRWQEKDGGRSIPPPRRQVTSFYCASALYLVSAALKLGHRRVRIAAGSS